MKGLGVDPAYDVFNQEASLMAVFYDDGMRIPTTTDRTTIEWWGTR